MRRTLQKKLSKPAREVDRGLRAARIRPLSATSMSATVMMLLQVRKDAQDYQKLRSPRSVAGAARRHDRGSSSVRFLTVRMRSGIDDPDPDARFCHDTLSLRLSWRRPARLAVSVLSFESKECSCRADAARRARMIAANVNAGARGQASSSGSDPTSSIAAVVFDLTIPWIISSKRITRCVHFRGRRVCCSFF